MGFMNECHISHPDSAVVLLIEAAQYFIEAPVFEVPGAFNTSHRCTAGRQASFLTCSGASTAPRCDKMHGDNLLRSTRCNTSLEHHQGGGDGQPLDWSTSLASSFSSLSQSSRSFRTSNHHDVCHDGHNHCRYSSSSSDSSTSSCSSLGHNAEPSPFAALTDTVSGVMDSVQTARKHPVLATVLWLLGGSVEQKEARAGPKGPSPSLAGSASTSSRSSGNNDEDYICNDENNTVGKSSAPKNNPRQPCLADNMLARSRHPQTGNADDEDKDGRQPDIHRLRWTAGAATGTTPPKTKVKDRVIYFLEGGRPSSAVPGLAPPSGNRSFQGGRLGGENGGTIAVERITHMDRLEEDDLGEPRRGRERERGKGARVYDQENATCASTAQRQLEHYNNRCGECSPGIPPELAGSGAAGNDPDVSPQWGWYVALTPPKPEFFQAGNNGAGLGGHHHHHHHHHHHRGHRHHPPRVPEPLRPAMT